jgi:uncharacterized protein (TIGR02996 family)
VPRYEDGKRFWYIALNGATVTTTSGKLGAKGRTSTRKHRTAGAALSAHDDLVLEKKRAGFVRVEAPEPAPAPAPAMIEDPDERLEELEARLAEHPGDREMWMVYSDLLQKRGDPRGELAALQAAADAERATNPNAKGATQLAVARYFAQHVRALLGPLAALVRKAREPSAPPFVWQHGAIRRVELASGDGDVAAILGQVFEHPAGRLVFEVALQVDDRAQAMAALDQIAAHAPPLVELDLFARADLGDLGDTLRRVPRLERLHVTARSFELGDLRLPALTRARFFGLALSPSCMDSIAVAPWPRLERLELRLGTRFGTESAAFEHVKPLLERADMPALTHLKIRGAPFAGAIARAIADGPLAGQLVVLDLSHGTIAPTDALYVQARKDRFANLRELWIPFGGVFGADATTFEGVAKHVVSDKRAPLDDLEVQLGVDDSGRVSR